MPNRVNVPAFSAYLYRFAISSNASLTNSNISRLAIRYEKLDANSLALVKLAAIRTAFKLASMPGMDTFQCPSGRFLRP